VDSAKSTFKVDPPPHFTGKSGDLRGFLTKAREYYEKPEEDWSEDTEKILANYDNFTNELKKVFGVVDEERAAERESYSSYAKLGQCHSMWLTSRESHAKTGMGRRRLHRSVLPGTPGQYKG
jgi:hypothetical protein